MPMKAPAFSLDYFPSREVAWSLFRESKVVIGAITVPSGANNQMARLDYFQSRIGTYGSAGSSNGPWERDLLMPSGPHTPYSTGNSPPLGTLSARSHRNSISNSLSTSPEQRVAKRSNSNLSAAFSSFSRPFAALGSSPTASDRFRPDADLSTSAPASGITWGSNTFYSSSSNSPEKRRRGSSRRNSFKTYDSTYSSDEEDYWLEDSEDDALNYSPVKDSKAPIIKTTYKNQNQFEEEAHTSLSLLPQKYHHKYEAYRDIYSDQLSIWGLYIQRAEILKFNGLTNYWPPEMASNQQSSSSSQQANRAIPSTAPTFPSPIPSSNPAAILNRERSIFLPTFQGTHEDLPSMDPGLYLPIADSAKLLRAGEQRNKMLEHPDTLAHAYKIGETPLSCTERLRTSCYRCHELVEGLFVICPTTVHRAHWDCHNKAINEHGQGQDWTNFGAAGCRCPGTMVPRECTDATSPHVKTRPGGQ